MSNTKNLKELYKILKPVKHWNIVMVDPYYDLDGRYGGFNALAKKTWNDLVKFLLRNSNEFKKIYVDNNVFDIEEFVQDYLLQLNLIDEQGRIHLKYESALPN